MQNMKPVLLILIPMSAPSLAALDDEFKLVNAPAQQDRRDAVARHGARIQVVFTNGSTGLTASEIDAMPSLSLACAQGAGYENIAVAHARARGIVVANGAGTNDDCVADHAIALLLAVVRDIPGHDRACRQGVWRDALPMRPQLAHKRLGLLGLGNVGRKIAQRGAAFDLDVGYHTRSAREDVPFRYFDSLIDVAAWCDFLVVAVPGGAATRHLVDGKVIAALGASGFLVNIARGSVVDTAALAQALLQGRLAGAGLDVYESEPLPPADLIDLPNVVLTPHVAGTSPEAKDAGLQCFLTNARLHFSGQPVRSPVGAPD